MANSNERDILLENLSEDGPDVLRATPISAIVDGDNLDNDLTGTADDDTISGRGGDDDIAGLGGNDLLRGGGGDDKITGGAGNDQLNGGGGEDLLIGQRGDDVLNGGSGDDDVRGGGGDDILRGQAGDDDINGGGGDDEILGAAGDDTIRGNLGDDDIHGGNGTDTALYSGRAAQYTVDLGAGTITDTRDAISNDGTDTLTSVEILEFEGGGRMLIVGATGFATIGAALAEAQDGDIIQIAAGTYNEQVVVDSLQDLTFVGETDAAGNNLVTITAPAAVAVTAPGQGEDEDIDAAAVITAIDAGSIRIENINVDGDDAGGAIVGGAGTPYFAGIALLDTGGVVVNVGITGVRQLVDGELAGGNSGDGIVAVNSDSEARDLIIRDVEITDFQNTGIMVSGDGLSATVFRNTIEGAGFIAGESAPIQIGVVVEDGAAGDVRRNDISEIGTLRGDVPTVGVFVNEAASGVQVVNNTFTGVGQDNTHTGVIVDATENVSVIDNTFDGLLNGFAGVNDVDGLGTPSANTYINMFASVETAADGERPGLNVAISAIENDSALNINGTDGTDLFSGSAQGDSILLGDGNDRVDAFDGDDVAVGGEGNDTLNLGGGDDIGVGQGGSDLLNGGSGDDDLRGGAGNDQLNGQAGNDDLNGGGGDDVLNGADGDDFLFGNDGDDTINGGDGADEIEGGAGDDALDGQGGIDTFIFSADDAGSDVVSNFAAGEVVALDGFGFADDAAAEAAFSQAGADVVFSAGGVQVTFTGADLADVTANLDVTEGSAIARASFDFGGVSSAPAKVEPLGDDDGGATAPATSVVLSEVFEDTFVAFDDDISEIA